MMNNQLLSPQSNQGESPVNTHFQTNGGNRDQHFADRAVFWKNTLRWIFFLAIAIFSCLFGFAMGQLKFPGDQAQIDKSVVEEEQISPEASSIPIAPGSDVEAKKLTFSDDQSPITFEYPLGWSVEWKNEVSPDRTDDKYRIRGGDYAVEISFPSDFGPGPGCLFPDSSEYSAHDYEKEYLQKCDWPYVQFKGVHGLNMRRKSNPGVDDIDLSDQSKYSLSVLTNTEGDYYSMIPPMNYLIPISFDPQVLSQMDQIVSSVRRNTSFRR